MHTVLAISLAVQRPIQTRWPIRPSDTWDVLLTKLVTGRDVQTSNPVNILWTIGEERYFGKGSRLKLNRFVPLINDTAVSDSCLQERTVDEEKMVQTRTQLSHRTMLSTYHQPLTAL